MPSRPSSIGHERAVVSAILVTNAGSPPGVELRYALAAHGAVLACGPEPETAMEPLFRGIAVRWVRADLSHSRARRGLLFGAALDARIQAVVHAPPRDTRRPHDAADTVRELLHLCERHPTIQRFVYRSTGEVYRVGPGDPALIDEEHPVESDPSAPGWLRDLVEADQAACARIGTSPLRVTVLRSAELFAPGADGQLQRWLRSDPCVRPLGYDPIVNLITREDLVRAIALAVRAHESGVFNIAGADLLPLSELASRSGRRCLPLPGWLVPASYGLRALAGPGFDYRTSERRFHFGGVLCGRSALATLGYQPRAGLWGTADRLPPASVVGSVSLNGPPPRSGRAGRVRARGESVTNPKTILSQLSRGDDAAPALSAPEMKPLTWRALRDLAARTLDDLERDGNRTRRPDRHRAAQRAGERGRLRLPRRGGCHRAAQSGISRGRVRVLSRRPAAEGAGPRAGCRIAGPRGGGKALHPHRRAASATHGRSRNASGWRLRRLEGEAANRPGQGRPTTSRCSCTPRGTTSRPKLVPLSQSNLSASAGNIAAALALTPADVCLQIMPLFHIHGLIAGVLSSLSVGAQVFVHSGLQRAALLPLARGGPPHLEHRRCRHAPGDPRDGPSGNKEILARRPAAPDPARRPRPCRPRLMAELEAAFQAPGDRGVRDDRGVAPDGVEPAAAAAAQARHGGHRRPARRSRSWTRRATLMPPDHSGEIVVRGANVTRGLREQSGGERQVLHQRLVPHRRRGAARRPRATCGSSAASRR